MKRLLLLEDDLNLHETVSEFLEEAGFAVVSCYNGEEAETALYENKFDLLLLDVNVPSPNGFELLKISRAQGNTTPAIFLTSRNAIDDLEEGYDSGCDDYLKKPFELKELLIRIQSLLKRSFYHTPTERITINERFSFDTKDDTLLDQDKPVHLH
ncbi:MAG: response regulator, partial [Thiovulaceae bacterium]|nr:response regulator [Sulfurimonadaceae bacterium]